ncbi:MAG: CRISPR-associated protein Csx11 [Chloroflexi bacterium]|nr:MAG: CRISPR-associated protein Csx11 [Chloroflexota bacterium]
MNQLEKLAQHREAILLAEVVGWLHDYYKCSEEQLQVQSANKEQLQALRNRHISGIERGGQSSELTNRFSNLDSASLTILSETEKIPDLLNRPRTVRVVTDLRRYLSRCHNTAHFDKQDPLDEQGSKYLNNNKQNYPGTQISTAFGFETAVSTNLTPQLWTLPWNDVATFSKTKRHRLLNAVQSLFTTVGADTRRPINEISLWDWGVLVGALYKTAVAAMVLGHQLDDSDLRWRLLAVRTDALTYLTNSFRLSDLMARKKMLQTAFNKVRTLLEETYPLAAEVYRDENGSLYVVPDLLDLLTLQDNNNQTLQSHIQQQFTTDGEIAPQITLDPTAWWGQDPKRTGEDEIPPAGAILSSPTALQSDALAISEAWRGKRQTICPICGLRPCVSKQLGYCQVCGERRKGRVGEWLKDQRQTIWLDEVADSNGRLALITGTFDLTNWLDGSLVATLLVQEPGNGNSAVPKTPSFARLRRIWRTTQRFWEQVQSETNRYLTDSRQRLTIELANPSTLTPNQTYELDLDGTTHMSVLWDGSHLISTDNLSYTAIQLGIQPEQRKTPVDAALAVGVWLEENNQTVFQLNSDDEKNIQYDVKIVGIDYQDTDYAATIPIFAQPRTFMALVPADKALAVINPIKSKFELEMGKVRNRLPLHLGALFFHRRTPLRVALDAGQRMLKYDGRKAHDEVWQIAETKQSDQTIAITLKQHDRSFVWSIPARMGDEQTEDKWYPYVFIQNDVSGRKRIFKGQRPQSDSAGEEYWLVHAAELQVGDEVYFTPATFDFEWLTSAGQRFEIAYDGQGKRRNHLTRPYFLDELTALQEVWDLVAGLNGLTSSQIYALRDLVETKREGWQPTAAQCQRNGMFYQFCHDAVRNANWKKEPTQEQINRLTDWIVSGLFTDTIRLYMGIMKQKPQREDKNNE